MPHIAVASKKSFVLKDAGVRKALIAALCPGNESQKVVRNVDNVLGIDVELQLQCGRDVEQRIVHRM